MSLAVLHGIFGKKKRNCSSWHICGQSIINPDVMIICCGITVNFLGLLEAISFVHKLTQWNADKPDQSGKTKSIIDN
jgi:hypothetical protein